MVDSPSFSADCDAYPASPAPRMRSRWRALQRHRAWPIPSAHFAQIREEKSVILLAGSLKLPSRQTAVGRRLLSVDIFVDPSATGAEVIRAFGQCYRRISPSFIAPDTYEGDIEGEFTECEECESSSGSSGEPESSYQSSSVTGSSGEAHSSAGSSDVGSSSRSIVPHPGCSRCNGQWGPGGINTVDCCYSKDTYFEIDPTPIQNNTPDPNPFWDAFRLALNTWDGTMYMGSIPCETYASPINFSQGGTDYYISIYINNSGAITGISWAVGVVGSGPFAAGALFDQVQSANCCRLIFGRARESVSGTFTRYAKNNRCCRCEDNNCAQLPGDEFRECDEEEGSDGPDDSGECTESESARCPCDCPPDLLGTLVVTGPGGVNEILYYDEFSCGYWGYGESYWELYWTGSSWSLYRDWELVGTLGIGCIQPEGPYGIYSVD